MQPEFIEGGANYTSTRLRTKTVEIMSYVDRPLTSHEILSHIRQIDPALYAEVAGKCPDYIRIILSLTKGNIIGRYKSIRGVKGIDRRAIFYGLTSKSYATSEWIRIGDAKARKSSKNSVAYYQNDLHNMPVLGEALNPLTNVSSLSSLSPLSPLGVTPSLQAVAVDPSNTFPIQKEDDVTVDSVKESWNRLSGKFPFRSTFWTELFDAIFYIDDKVQSECDANGIIAEILKTRQSLQDPEARADCVNILLREIAVKKEEITALRSLV